jgi:O-acetyl-ADP-ribose deacetylase (regulator of RNase III)
MKLYLLDINKHITDLWNLYFKDEPNVEIVLDDFQHFMDTHEVDCVVSPANSYGLMDGGYDLAITKYFGRELPRKVQNYILDHYYGEQPVGTSFLIDTGVKNIKLIHTPTMRIPSSIKEPMVVYQAMRSTLITALEHDIKSIVIPAFGGRCGMMDPQELCELMYEGYKQIQNPPKELNWSYAERWSPEN